MNPIRRTLTAAAFVLVAAAVTAAPASARPEPSGATYPPAYQKGCPLERIGPQLVRCDDLTGAGVRAPTWIPDVSVLAGIR